MTTIRDTLYQVDGKPARGGVTVCWPAFTSAAGQNVPAGSTSRRLVDGLLCITLMPTIGAAPAFVYNAVWHFEGGPEKLVQQTWEVRDSTAPLQLSAVVVQPGVQITINV